MEFVINEENIEEYISGKYDQKISIIWKYYRFKNLSINITILDKNKLIFSILK